MSRSKAKILTILSCILIILAGCEQSYPAYNTRFVAFGTLIDLSLIDVEPGLAAQVAEAIRTDFEYMDRTWRTGNTGPLTRINDLLPTRRPFVAPPSVVPLILRAQQLSKQSGGLFNPAIGELSELWGFHIDEPECKPPPSPAAIAELVAANPQMSDLHIDGIHTWSTNPTVQLEFGNFAIGYGIDMAIQHLRDMGVDNALLNVGGDLRVIGSRDGRPWRIAIRGPSGAGVYATVNVKGDESVFTTGEYERYFVYEGRQYHHILDPRTGYPASDTRSVSIIHTDAATADAAATALFIAGPKHWHKVAKKLGIRYALLVDKSDRLHMNPAMAERIKLLVKDQQIALSPPLTE